ncbi:MAG: hypothetical protein CM15mP55_1740 [Hyphomicrobiales bacterium]|nr:MAG: hypothetical protein CM15mP55_1740 [Hyphomicrobiales bacterium]
MASEIRVPTLRESVTEATIAQWYKNRARLCRWTSRFVSLKPTR